VIAVAGTGALTRLRTLPVSVCLAAGVVGLLLYLNLVFEVRHSLLLVIPTPARSAGCGTWRGTGFHDANRYAPPAPNRPGLLLLAASGVGITRRAGPTSSRCGCGPRRWPGCRCSSCSPCRSP